MSAWLQKSSHRVECAWCRKVLAYGAEPVSHGICESCFQNQIEGFDPPPLEAEEITLRGPVEIDFRQVFNGHEAGS